MIKIGTPISDPNGNPGKVERNSRRTGEHMIRVNGKWFLASECKR